jgi:CRISPR-associated protein (TIGR02710 family)
VYSIGQQRPRRLLFFVSPETRWEVEGKILPGLPEDYRYLGLELIETESAEALEACYEVLRREIPEHLERWGLTWTDMVADFTGGTKVMSAAVTLVCAQFGVQFTYVGGAGSGARNKSGVGVVLDGKEKVFLHANPWQQMAEERIALAIDAFSKGHLAGAVDLVPKDTSRTADAVRSVLQGFAAWDRQRYERAARRLEDGVQQLELALEGSRRRSRTDLLRRCSELLPSLKAVAGEAERLCRVQDEPRLTPHHFRGLDGTAIPRDLVATAVRRARVHGDPDDGVMLLYSAMEKLARGRLLVAHQINNSRCPKALIDDHADQLEWAARLDSDPVELPLERSFDLLRALSDPVGQRYATLQTELRKVQVERNHSWREHAYSHIELETFEKLLVKVLEFLEIEESDLPVFPWETSW